MELIAVPFARPAEIERAVAAFARSPNGGLIVPAERIRRAFIAKLIVELAARHQLPAVYPRSLIYAKRRRPDVLRA